MRNQAFTRRAFTAMAAVGWSRVAGASQRVRVGVIGAGGRGDKLLDELLKIDGVSVTAVSDLHAERMNLARRKTGGTARAVDDYRRVLDDRDVDAVVIATPDHWHAIQFVDACDAGKDVYVEKPLSLTVVEGAAMVEAARRNARVVQVGAQRRSSAMVRQAVEFIRSGGIGKVTVARAFDNLNEWPSGIGFAPDEPVPAEFDWDRWLGPAPLRPYNRNRTFYNYRWFHDYSGGQLTNNGIHLIDVVRWALDLGWPRKVAAMGGIYALKDGRETPDTLEVMWEFVGGVLVTFTQYNANDAPVNSAGASLEFRGTKGTLYVLPDRFEVVPEAISSRLRYRPNPLDRSNTRAAWMSARKPVIEKRVVSGEEVADSDHVRNFVECVRSRAACNAGIEAGHRSTSTCLIGNIALKTESTLAWDGERERFVNNDAANKLLHYRYRSPYQLRGVRGLIYG
jgi:predicted dehydrogenase